MSQGPDHGDSGLGESGHGDPRLRIPDELRGEVRQRVVPGVKRDSGPSDTLGMARTWATALDFIFTILAGAAAGWGFDWWRGTKPVGVMVGLAAGFVFAFVRIVRSTMAQEKAEAERKRAGKQP